MTLAVRVVLIAAAVAAALAGGAAAPGATAATPQTITVTRRAPATARFNEAFQLTATASSGLPVQFSSSGPCNMTGTINEGATFVMTSGIGTCQILYSQSGNGSFDTAAQVVDSVLAQKADQEVQLATLEDATFGDPDFPIDGLATSGLAVSFSASGDCALSDGTIHLAGAGSCNVTASQGGDANYNAATPASQTFAIAKADQQIAFAPIPTKALGDPNFRVHAETDSKLPLRFSARGPCSVRGSLVHIVAPGTCTVMATQPGNANYNSVKAGRAFKIVSGNCAVPSVVGKRLRAAKKALLQSHCGVGRITYAASSAGKRGRVVAQSKRPGRILRGGSKVGLVVGRG